MSLMAWLVVSRFLLQNKRNMHISIVILFRYIMLMDHIMYKWRPPETLPETLHRCRGTVIRLWNWRTEMQTYWKKYVQYFWCLPIKDRSYVTFGNTNGKLSSRIIFWRLVWPWKPSKTMSCLRNTEQIFSEFPIFTPQRSIVRKR